MQSSLLSLLSPSVRCFAPNGCRNPQVRNPNFIAKGQEMLVYAK